MPSNIVRISQSSFLFGYGLSMLVGPLAVPAKRKYVRAAEGEEEEEGIEVPEEERERIRY